MATHRQAINVLYTCVHQESSVVDSASLGLLLDIYLPLAGSKAIVALCKEMRQAANPGAIKTLLSMCTRPVELDLVEMAVEFPELVPDLVLFARTWYPFAKTRRILQKLHAKDMYTGEDIEKHSEEAWLKMEGIQNTAYVADMLEGGEWLGEE